MTTYFAIQALDKPGHTQLRAEVRPVHLDYLKSHLPRLQAVGPLLDDEGANAIGSLLVIEAESRAEAEAFAANDPYAKAGLFQSVTVTRWRKVFFDGQSLL
jgi:uncharacterized protein YciI